MESYLDIPLATTDNLLDKTFFDHIRSNNLLLTTHDKKNHVTIMLNIVLDLIGLVNIYKILKYN